MQRITRENPEKITESSGLNTSIHRISSVWGQSAHWLSVHLEPQDRSGLRLRLAVACAIIFLLGLGVRLLHWQDSQAETAQTGPGMSAIARHYESEAQRMLKEDGILFPRTPVDPGDARLILHPPGYSAFIAAIYASLGDSRAMVTRVQMFLDALSAIVVFLIAAELFNQSVAIIAAILVALSPHFAHYSLWFSPDTLPILPILVAVYLTIKATRRPVIFYVVGAGAMLGLSCWFRANGLLLAPFLAAAMTILVARGKRFRYAVALVGTTILVVSPITIRNWLLYHRFIPISVDAGLALVEGIAEYDEEGRFGMPRFDDDALRKDLEWHGRPEYGANLWSPDGIERDGYRFRRGLDVIRSNPPWFAGVMIRRAMFMLRYDKARKAVWPLTTASVPQVAAEPAFDHDIALGEQSQASWSATASDLSAGGVTIAPQAQTLLRDSLQLTGDSSEFGDQFASAPIVVDKATDYLLTLSACLISGPAAVKVTTVDRRITLASAILPSGSDKKVTREERKRRVSDDEARPADLRWREIRLPFASGNRAEVSLVISNNGASTSPPVVEINQCQLYNLGQTPHLWTRPLRLLVRRIQLSLYSTSPMLPFVMIGIALVVVAARKRAILTLMAVPAYYLVVHSVVHTEYRYILAIHYFLFCFAAIAIYCAGSLIVEGTRCAVSALKNRVG
ncbi:MAG TPA: glycosyltransferase family 39 protein [Blastocatellia bacterium]|nr:glycosyltransferase family 39 protein [Blastocatellia bacterium]